MFKFVTAAGLLASLFAMSLVNADEHGKAAAVDITNKLRECAGCHGTDGISIAPTMPNLAGQKEQYLVAAITAYRDGTRSGVNAAMMTPMAAGLSDEEIAALAAHFAAMQ